jgi:hypothetical protein
VPYSQILFWRYGYIRGKNIFVEIFHERFFYPTLSRSYERDFYSITPPCLWEGRRDFYSTVPASLTRVDLSQQTRLRETSALGFWNAVQLLDHCGVYRTEFIWRFLSTGGFNGDESSHSIMGVSFLYSFSLTQAKDESARWSLSGLSGSHNFGIRSSTEWLSTFQEAWGLQLGISWFFGSIPMHLCM